MDLFDNRSILDGLKGICFPNGDEVESIRKDNHWYLIHSVLEELHKGNFRLQRWCYYKRGKYE